MIIKERKVILLKGWKFRVLIYLLLLLGMALYLVFYLDSIRFFNLKKTLLSFKDKVELVGFERVLNDISPDNGLHAKLEIISGNPYLKMEGFEKELLNKKNSNIRKRKALHPSLNLALFCMGYASDFLLYHYQNNTLGTREVEILENVYLYVYKEIIKPISLNSMSVNDHAVAERIQFILLFSAYLKEHYPDKTELLNRLLKDFNICLGFLIDRKFFTWQTNHGIMQLRSLAQLAGAIENDKLKDSLLVLFDKRLTDIIPYHIGHDGAIYEAASGYWTFIYNQFSKITGIKSVENLKSVALLKEELKKSQKFIGTVTTNDGFLQGLGDSYSMYDPDNLKYISIQKNRYFRFSNELIGANWSSGHYHCGVLFVSLNTPPNAHKLPEDLAVYLYINHPVFSNTGTFSYDMSSERLFFKTEESQSTVRILNTNFTEPVYSKLFIKEFNSNNNSLTAIGSKQYPDNKSIIRFLRIDPEREIYIKDSIYENNTLVSYYNIHPDIKVRKISNSEVLLGTVDSVYLSFISNNNIEITDGYVSERKEELTKIKRLKITGNPIEVMIHLPELYINQNMELVTENLYENNRFNIASRLELKYGNRQINPKGSFINRSKVTILVLIVFIFSGELYVLFLGQIKDDEESE